MATTAADLLVAELRDRGVPFVATLNGHGLDPFYVACRRGGMRVIDVRNEQAASYMAEVAGRLSRSVGVCAVSGAVAHANALSGVLNAHLDGAPMLLITGITPIARLGLGDFQDFDPVPMTRPITKLSRVISTPESVARIVHDAFVAATTGRPGPVHLALPLDVAEAQVDPSRVVRSRVRSGAVRIDDAGDPGLVVEAVELLRESQRPVLVAGSGVHYARAERELASFIRRQEIPVVVPIWDRGSIATPLHAFLGVVGAASGSAEILPDADFVLLLGAEPDYRVGQLQPPIVSRDAKVVRVHTDEGRLRSGLEADVSIQGSPRMVLRELEEACEQLDCPPATAWLEEARARRDQFRQRCRASADKLSPGITGRDVVTSIQVMLTDDTVLLVDGGNIGQWFHQLLPDRYPGHWVTCGASGVVGWGVPGAMAARALHPERPVILLSGDGSFTFTVAELECAARQGLPFVAVIADDEQWGISLTGHVARYGAPLYSTLGPTRLDLVAEGLGCAGMRVENKEELAPRIREALSLDRPAVIQVPIVPGGPRG